MTAASVDGSGPRRYSGRGKANRSLDLNTAAAHMFRWPDKLITTILAYGLVFIGVPLLCLLSYLWVTGAL